MSKRKDVKHLTREETIELYKTYIPEVTEKVMDWKADRKGLVTLSIENKGAMNRIFQKLFKKPRISYIHLDPTGSYVFSQIDGQTTIGEIAGRVHEHFGAKAEPLYERLLKFFEIVESYDFVRYKKPAD